MFPGIHEIKHDRQDLSRFCEIDLFVKVDWNFGTGKRFGVNIEVFTMDAEKYAIRGTECNVRAVGGLNCNA